MGIEDFANDRGVMAIVFYMAIIIIGRFFLSIIKTGQNVGSEREDK